MIRYAFINNQILKIYRRLSSLVFPLDIFKIVEDIPNCKYMSYQKFAEINRCSVDDVVNLCESRSGCTHYNLSQNQYLILCNRSVDENPIGRQRWTCGHEIGHVVCNHLQLAASEHLSENNIVRITNKDYELEADYFSATILAPFPIFSLFNIHSAEGIKIRFGLSTEASEIRYKQYLRWKSYHRKTSWENDIVNTFYEKFISSPSYSHL